MSDTPDLQHAGAAHETDPIEFYTAHGHAVWFGHPDRTPVNADDLRVHLSRICRYGGARQWTVLQHLDYCVRLARRYGDTRALPYVAAHDLHEYVVGDLPSWLKRHLPDWKPLENRWEAHVHASLGLEWPADGMVAAFVRSIDALALYGEMLAMAHAGACLVRERYGIDIGPAGELYLVQAHAEVGEHAGPSWAAVAGALGSERVARLARGHVPREP